MSHEIPRFLIHRNFYITFLWRVTNPIDPLIPESVTSFMDKPKKHISVCEKYVEERDE